MSHTHTAEQKKTGFERPGRYEQFFNDWNRVNELIRTSPCYVFRDLQFFFQTYNEECFNNPNLLDSFITTAKAAGNEKLCEFLQSKKKNFSIGNC